MTSRKWRGVDGTGQVSLIVYPISLTALLVCCRKYAILRKVLDQGSMHYWIQYSISAVKGQTYKYVKLV